MNFNEVLLLFTVHRKPTRFKSQAYLSTPDLNRQQQPEMSSMNTAGSTATAAQNGSTRSMAKRKDGSRPKVIPSSAGTSRYGMQRSSRAVSSKGQRSPSSKRVNANQRPSTARGIKSSASRQTAKNSKPAPRPQKVSDTSIGATAKDSMLTTANSAGGKKGEMTIL